MKKAFFAALAVSVFAGCASVPMESKEAADKLKAFNPPSAGNSGLYVYRSGSLGTALKKDIWVDDQCVGETARNVFFYHEVKGDQEHKISTESEFSPNSIALNTKSGQNYFVKQYIKMGVFVGGANVEVVEAEEGKKDLSDLGLATKGTCSSPTP